MLIGWLVFAPPKIGGQTSYIIIVGNSMEPKFHFGDLVLIRPAENYKIGDIVTYSQPEIGTIFHRIIAYDGHRYVLKGDNNSWEDSYKPHHSEIMGKYWFFIPSAGNFLRKLRSPGNFSLVIIFFAILFIFTISNDLRKDKRKRKKENKMSDLPETHGNPNDRLYIISVVGCIALILAFISFTKPVQSAVADNFTYTNIGTFEYSSDVPEDIYETNQLQSGDPIFRQINDSVNVTFSYELSSREKAVVSGTFELLAVIQDATGWEKSIVLVQPSLIQEPSFISSAILNFTEIDRIIDNFEKQTGITNKRYTLILQPKVEIAGTLGGRPFEDTFTPDLSFNMDEQKLTMVGDPEQINTILNPTLGGTVLGSNASANTMKILGIKMNVLVVRAISIILVAAVIVGLFRFNKRFGAAISGGHSDPEGH